MSFLILFYFFLINVLINLFILCFDNQMNREINRKFLVLKAKAKKEKSKAPKLEKKEKKPKKKAPKKAKTEKKK